jgi:hypothetical protein
MTNAVPDDCVDPTTDQQTHQPDELEDWLTDLRVTLNDDPPDWLTPQDDNPDLVPAAPPPTEDHPLSGTDTAAGPARPGGTLKHDRSVPAVGRHRAAE